MMKRTIIYILMSFSAACLIYTDSYSQQPEVLSISFEDAMQIAFQRSRSILNIRDEFREEYLNVKAQRAALRSYSNLNADLPSFSKSITRYFDSSTESWVNVPDHKTNMEINWEIGQPIITNGNFSLKSNLNTLAQKDEDRLFKSKLFLEFRQPLFTRNHLKKSIWREELNFEETELESISDLLRQYARFNRYYYDLFSKKKELEIDSVVVMISRTVFNEAQRQYEFGNIDSTEIMRLEVDLLLNMNKFLRTQDEIFQREMEFKHNFGINLDQKIDLTADLTIEPIPIDMDRALEIGLANSPSLKELEIAVEITKDGIEMVGSWSEFRGNIIATYGVERDDIKFRNIFRDFNKTQSLDLEFSFPLWDSKRNAYFVESARMYYFNAVNRLENTKVERANGIKSALRDLISSQNQVMTLEENTNRARLIYEQSLEKFLDNEINSQELSRILDEYRKVQNLYLEAFVDYKRSIITLQSRTYWDFEQNKSVIDIFGGFLKMLDN
ncbi:MAG: TolC family protein [bacterium]|nr:TolC family protein [bacterium]